MKRKIRKSFQQLVNQNKLEIETNPLEMKKIEKRIDEKHSKG